ncbi:transglycosylase domain-containing protein [Actinocrinis puniceicyclus]|uniref:Transglycosylase domain-containing protein n=1 Tax=Actinocrinis puniceicyclus TaxID=977794 RepID=A0A8J8BAA4_9ACTN|nr:transglycosylase domain-containing protein [Actinocrinis puniceicyclus]MBS2962752.1 transglycosylase domain-containing protein [Actinocrinis puniceicyclus]
MVTGRTGYSGASGVGRLISHLGTFVMVSALAGVLLAGLTLPFVGSFGLTAKAASDHFEDLPDDFETPVLPQRTRILADDGSVIAYTWGDFGNRVVVPMAQISPNMPHALVSIEDVRYYQHGGIDLKGTLRALVNDSAGGNTQGGSSITQQYVKNVLLLEAGTDKTRQQAATADTFSRKITELKYAIAVEKTLSKDQILERYLNLVYFGNGAYGVEAAAERYFSTTSAKLTVPQAALLAAIVNSPTEFDPFAHPADALKRRNIVLQDMANPTLNYITAAQAAQYEKMPLSLSPTSLRDGCITAKGSAAYFCNYVYNTFIRDSAYGKTMADREALWLRGGLTIQTTMSVKDEQSADAAIAKRVYATDFQKHDIASALVMVDPGSGQIKAMAQSIPMGNGSGQTFINLSADRNHNGTNGFQAGSSFKIFVGIAALEQGIDPNQPIDAPGTIDDAGTQFAACAGSQTQVVWPPDVPAKGKYTPSNDDMADHKTAMPNAFAQSINTYFLRMEEQTGLCKPAQVAESMGVTQDNDTGKGQSLMQIPSFTLGTNPITPIEMASAYATLAAQGTYCVPYVITQVTDVSGKNYGGQNKSCRQVLDPNIANEITSMLQGVVQNGTAAGAVPLSDSRPIAGKTGTTDSSIATWFDGYTPQLAAATWTGFINWDSKTKLENIKIGPTYYPGQVFGSSISAPTFNDAMTGALAGTQVVPFTAPTGFNANPNPGGAGGGGNGNGPGGGGGGFLGGIFGGGGGGGKGH